MTIDKKSQFGIHRDLTPKMQTERSADDLDVVAYVNLALRRNGAMSITGNIGDKVLMLSMLEEALDVLRRQPKVNELVIPSSDLAIPEPVHSLRPE